MGSISKKLNKKKKLDISLSIKFVCDFCGFTRIVPQYEFQKMTDETFQNNKLFICNSCKIRMRPATIEADF